MPSDRAIRAVIALRQRQAEQMFSSGMSDPTGNAFDALIGEAIDEAWYDGFKNRTKEGRDQCRLTRRSTQRPT